MRTLICPAILALLVLSPATFAHGGTYRGPGSGTGPSGPSGPSTPGPGVPSPTGPGPGAGPATGGAGDATGDLTAWQQWWALNRDQYLQLKTAISESDTLSKSDTFFLGPEDITSRGPGAPTLQMVRTLVVPTLVALLSKERGPDISTAALLALAKVGDTDVPAVSAALKSELASSNQEIAESAAIALGVMSDPSSAGLLVELLQDTAAGRKLVGREEVPYRTRAFAAYALGLIGHRNKNADVRRFVVHHLVSQFEAEGNLQRDVPIACAIALGIVPLDPVLPTDADAPPSASRAGEVALLLKVLQDAKRPDWMRVYAPVAAARLAQNQIELQTALVNACGDLLATGANTSPALRQSVIAALGITADADEDPIDEHARALVRKNVTDGDRLSRRLALIALARISSRPGNHAGGAKTLDETRAFLLGELARGSTPERPWIGLALGLLERGVVASGGTASDAVRSALANALVDHGGPVEAGAYAIALGLIGGDVGKVLLPILEDTHDDQVRAYASVALGMARVPAAVEPLRKLVLSSRYRPGLLREASIGLGLLGDKTVSPQLVDMLRDAQGLSAQGAIATALGYVGDSRAVEPLLAIAVDATRINGSRAFAIVSLGLICDRRMLPWNAVFAADANYWLPPDTLFDPTSQAGILDIL